VTENISEDLNGAGGDGEVKVGDIDEEGQALKKDVPPVESNPDAGAAAAAEALNS